jgi:hypothetical protein|tara:strand:- start:83 stop:382 length:300 start_codon:yes stop_codon:yes gene_type:complete
MKHLRPTTVEENSDGTTSFVTHQDAEGILNNNKELLNNYGDKLTFGKQQHGMRVASIPVGIWEKWMKETNGAIEKDSKLMKKYLNDPDNAFLRTTPTRL